MRDSRSQSLFSPTASFLSARHDYSPFVCMPIICSFKHMVKTGLIDEVKSLRDRFELNADLPSMRSVGYRQVWQHLEKEYDVSAMLERGIIATRQLAKRQLTWLRSWSDLNEFYCEEDDRDDRVFCYLEKELADGNDSRHSNADIISA